MSGYGLSSSRSFTSLQVLVEAALHATLDDATVEARRTGLSMRWRATD